MRVLLLAMVVFLVSTPVSTALAAPFAQRVEIPGELMKEGHAQHLEAMAARKSQIPSREEVGIPPYPGAKILFTQMNNQSYENGKPVELPKRIYMGTADPVEPVVEFYKQNLEGWKYREIYGVPTFYLKEGEFKPMEDNVTPRIVIAPEFRSRPLMPESKTTIDIYYPR